VTAARASLLLAAALPLAGCRDWRAHVEPGRAAAEPVQEDLAGAPPIDLEVKGYRVRLLPRATYRITGYAVETSRQLLDEWDFVVPMDVALVWGPVADPEALAHLKFHLSRRYVSYWWDGDLPAAARAALATHVANNHLIPANDEVAAEIGRIRAGDLVTLRGRLVDLEIRDAEGRERWKARTSLSRSDVGSGACEQIWLESAEVERP
jgi:hypothetical protein